MFSRTNTKAFVIVVLLPLHWTDMGEMHVGFTLVQNSLDYGFFRGIVPHSKTKWSERRWLPRGWSCSRQKTNQLNQRVLPAVYLLRQNDSVMKIIWSPLNNWNPPLDIPQPILSLVFFFFCKSGITLECSREKKLTPLEDFQIDIKIHGQLLLIFCLPGTLVAKRM